MFKISELFIYPVKSLGGISLSMAELTDRGFKYDRRWMLIDDNNRFISQREYATMALLRTAITDEHLVVTYERDNTFINIPLIPAKQEFVSATVWDDTCLAQLVCDEADAWFSNVIGKNIRLVYMPDNSRRQTDPEYAPQDSITSFSDAYPFLLIGQSSLDDLNARLADTLQMNRFRPNIVFTGGAPYQEDQIDSFTINDIAFNGVKLCARCNVITIDQSTAISSKEPTRTLASYRVRNKKIYFGQNVIHAGTGTIAVGDELIVLSTHHEERFFIPEKIK